MSKNHNDESGFFDDAGHSRRFIRNSNKTEKTEKSSIKKTGNAQGIKQEKRISSSIKYGKIKDETSIYIPLSVSEQIRIASGMKQAIFKITSYGKGAHQVINHLAYISRNFTLELEDQDGSLLTKKTDSNALISTWESIYFDERKRGRDTVHMIFSVPPGSCREVSKNLTREFLREEFKGEHDYVFVQHNDTEHPHIHAAICLRSIHGKKLDPRKQYINKLRKNYAEKCRENGIMLEASRRFERGLSGKSSRSELVNMRAKKQIVPKADFELLSKIKKELNAESNVVDTGEVIRKTRNQTIKAHFYNTARMLYNEHLQDPDTKKIETAQLLLDFSRTFPVEVTRADQLKKMLSSEKISKTEPARNAHSSRKMKINDVEIDVGW